MNPDPGNPHPANPDPANPGPPDGAEWDLNVVETVGAVDRPTSIRLPRLALGLAAMALVGALAGRSLFFGGTGASSPEDAVQNLASAVAAEDMVAALATLVPDEVGPLVDAYGDATAKADSLGLSRSGRTFAGVDVRIDGLELDVEPLGDDLAKVRIRHGTLSWTVDRSQFDDRLRDLSSTGALSSPRLTSGSISASDLSHSDRDHDRDPFVMVVQRHGSWYVSPAYTAAELLVVSTGIPRADLSRPIDERSVAPSPSDAVRRLAAAVNDDDVSAGIATTSSPEWAALRTYRDAIADVVGDLTIGRNQALEIDDLHLSEEHIDATHVKVRITGAAGTIRRDISNDYFLFPESRSKSIGPGQPRSAPMTRTRTWVFDGRCLRVDDQPEACVGDPIGRLSLGNPLGLATVESPYLVAVAERGGWAISPVSTVASYVRALVSSVGPDDLVVLAGREAEQPPTVDLSIDRTTAVDVGAKGYGVATLVVPGGSVVSVTGLTRHDEDFTIRVYRSPDDPDPMTTHLPTDATKPELLAPIETTTYRVVVADHRGFEDSASLRVTDLRPAPLRLGTALAGRVTTSDSAAYFGFTGVAGQVIGVSTRIGTVTGAGTPSSVDGAGRLKVSVLDLSNGEPVLGRSVPTSGRYLVTVIPNPGAVEEPDGAPLDFAITVVEVGPTFWESGASTVTVHAVSDRDSFVNVSAPGLGRFRVSGAAATGDAVARFVLSADCGGARADVAADGRSVEIVADPPTTECWIDVVLSPSSPPAAVTLTVERIG